MRDCLGTRTLTQKLNSNSGLSVRYADEDSGFKKKLLMVVTHWFEDHSFEAWADSIMRSVYSVGGGAAFVTMKCAQWRMKPRSLNSLALNHLDLPH